ncbi:ATP-binding protein [Streptomyces sp. NPDC005423]|uniref:ATP-binding protein n=1 Tax=Streptomyces sp. NPDC005423 TaxID=3155343 RepID=UPI0033B3ED59
MSIRGFADRWPFRRKLNLLVGIPLAVVAVLLSYLIADEIGQSQDASSAARLVRDSEQVAELVNLVEAEHQQAVLLSVRFEATHDGGSPSQSPYRKAQGAVDRQIEKVRSTFGDRLPATEAQALKEISGLETLRATVAQSYLPADNIDPAYANASEGLIEGLGLEHNENLSTTFTGNLLDAVLRADAAHSAFETSVFSATTGDSNALIEFTNAVGSYDVYTYQADRFARFASADQAEQLSGIEHNKAQRSIAEAYAELQIDPSALQAETPSRIRATFADAMSDYPFYPAQAAARLKITTSLIDQIAQRADDSSSDASWRAGILLNISLLCFALWLTFVVIVRRSVVRPVQALTGAAKQVAEVAGRELARVADDDAEDTGPPLLREIPVTARDEIGDLAEAFNHVQTTAAALLERQVLSRRNVAEMFGNVGRRVSNLTTRQLALIDAVERGETDPALLERLYSIDHIAVRLRRNADSLMLLAGIRETVLDGGPTELTNVVRAALGQIEGFQRVGLRAESELMVEPDIIGDLTLMVAELLENAVAFSPAGSPVEVVVRADPDGDGALIVIVDHGLGMSADRIAEENARLIRRERLDLVPTKVLGLFVVGTLARRWEIDVTLTRTPGGGVTAEITIPASLLLRMSPMTPGAPAARPAVTTVAARPAAIEAPASTTARPVHGDTTTRPVQAPAETVATGITPGVTAGAGPAAVSGPRPSAMEATGAVGGTDSRGAWDEHSRVGDHPTPLPRRVPRHDTDATDETPAPANSAQDSGTSAAAAPYPARDTPAPADSTPDDGASQPATRRPVRETAAPTDRAPDTRASWPSDSASDGGRSRSTTPFPTRDTSAPATPAPGNSVPGDGTSTGAGARSGNAGAVAGNTPFVPRPRPGWALPDPEDSPGAARPLRRRVRGATLRTADPAQSAARQLLPPADADAVRSALEEFEAAVEQAHRDSGSEREPGGGGPTGPYPNPRSHDPNHLPEGAEQ